MEIKDIKLEFDTIEEFQEAMNNLERYHTCKQSEGKIVAITMDNLGNTHCGYCNAIVKYPRMKKEKFEEWLKQYGNK
jgi:thiol-disulfide isomerase/thioredoxin